MDYHPDFGRTVINNGYILVYCPDHPRAWKKGIVGFVYAHRLAMEAKLGRLLLSEEHVHHMNENKQDNRPENLQVLSRAEHARLHRSKQYTPPKLTLECPECHKGFERRTGGSNQVLSRSQYKRVFCSRQCSGAFNTRFRVWRPVRDTAEIRYTRKIA